MARRAGAILAVSDVDRSVTFYRDHIGFEVEALYDDPPYATLALAGARLSLAEQGHPAEDRPGVDLAAPAEPFEPPWGGCRFFCIDPDGYLVEIEQPA